MLTPTCGCTVAKPDKEIYNEDEEGIIKGDFNVGDRIGVQEKQIIISTNDLSRPRITLTIKVTIPKTISIKPSLLFWRIGDELNQKNVTIEFAKESGMKLSKITSDSENFKFDYKEIENNSYQVSIIPLNTTESSKALFKISVLNKANEEKIYYLHALIK